MSTRTEPAVDVRVSRRGLVYSDRGAGAVIVLLHGWCLNRHLWDYEEETLASDRRVVVPDLAGFGDSSHLSGPYDLARYADDVGDLLAELRAEHVTIVGFAFGAAVAMALAAADSSRLERLVLIGVPSASAAPYERMPKAMRRDWPEFARLSANAICKADHSPATMSWLATMFGRTRLPVAIETVGLLAEFEPRVLAPRVSIPALFVHGALDDVVPPSVSVECAAAIRGARVEVVSGSGHLVILDQRAAFDGVLAAFIGAAAGS